MKDIRLFTSQPVAKFYDSLFLNLDLSFVPEFPKTGRKGFSNHSMICAFLVMKCEGFSMITDLLDYLNNNLLIAHYCGFDIARPLPSYWTFDRFLKGFDNQTLSDIMKSQVLSLAKKGSLILLLSGWTQLLLLQIPLRITQNLFFQINSTLKTSQRLTTTVNSLSTLHPTRPERKNMSSTGAIKTMSL